MQYYCSQSEVWSTLIQTSKMPLTVPGIKGACVTLGPLSVLCKRPPPAPASFLPLHYSSHRSYVDLIASALFNSAKCGSFPRHQLSSPRIPGFSAQKFDLVLRKKVGFFLKDLFFNFGMFVFRHRAVAFQGLCQGHRRFTSCPPEPLSVPTRDRGALGHSFLSLACPLPLCCLRFVTACKGLGTWSI